MGIHTSIEWCDSTVNPVVGCDGCELWHPQIGIRHCYAGALIGRYAGQTGWPASFDRPQFFPGRMEQAMRWPDLTGTVRPDKPWLDGLPRLVFVNDASDTFGKSIDPRSWLTPIISHLSESPHIWILLTKRPAAMFRYFRELGRVPRNFLLGTSVTSQLSTTRLRRLLDLRKIERDCLLWCSLEPLLGQVDVLDYLLPAWNVEKSVDLERPSRIDFDEMRLGLDWAVIGGESGFGARPCSLEWIADLLQQCSAAEVPAFVKQLGSNISGRQEDLSRLDVRADRRGKATDWSKWPANLLVRQMPAQIA